MVDTTQAELLNSFPGSFPDYMYLESEDVFEEASTAREASTGWSGYTLKDAYQHRLPVEYAADILELPSLNVFYGSPGTLKSFLLADLAICAVTGTNWLEPLPSYQNKNGFPIKKQLKVCWLDMDNGFRRTCDRFAALGKAYKAEPSYPLTIFTDLYPRPNASKPETLLGLADHIRENKVDLVFIDNLGLISGGIDENSSQMVEVMATLRSLASSTGASVNLIHHKSKGNVQGRKGDSMRGHSSIEAAIDLGILVDRANSDTVRLLATKTRGKDIEPFKARFTYIHDVSGNLTEARFYGISDEPSKEMVVKEWVIEILREGSMNKRTLVEKVKEHLPIGINKTRDIIDRMIEEEELRSEKGSKVNEINVSLIVD